MSDTQKNEYLPDYLVTPGEVISDYLDSYEMSHADLAVRSGLTTKTVDEILKGNMPITPETALKLEQILGRPAHFWNNLERRFQEDRKRLVEHNHGAKSASAKKAPTVYDAPSSTNPTPL
jgi:HTH-type transcriptional regulator / antitoxin HigA